MPTKKAAKPAKSAKPTKPSPSKKAPAPKPKIAPPPPAKPKETPKAAAPPKKEAPPAPVAPAFVREATAAERKAALESVLEKEAIPLPKPAVAAPAPTPPPPPAVRDASAADRKAAVEQLVQEAGVTGVLAKAPWKRGPPTPPPTPPAPPQPGQIIERAGPKVQMTKAPLESTVGRSPPRVVILDSNALMMQFQFHIDIEREAKRILNFNLEIVVPEIVLKELERLGREGVAKEAAEARMAAELARTFRVEPSPGDGDTGILRLAEKLNAVVVTNDKTLRARLRAKDIPNIYMRSRAFLTLEGHIPGM